MWEVQKEKETPRGYLKARDNSNGAGHRTWGNPKAPVLECGDMLLLARSRYYSPSRSRDRHVTGGFSELSSYTWSPPFNVQFEAKSEAYTAVTIHQHSQGSTKIKIDDQTSHEFLTALVRPPSDRLNLPDRTMY